PKSPKSIGDLKPSAVTMEKAKAGSLVHAVGTIKNTSDQQRFGVRVELELTDANGNPAGKASDYAQVIEPGQAWRFRALVLDPKGSKAVAGRVSSITEDN
ncbi:MAG: FxLYD domain-containing protein, partial [Gammaproteobacteria bacterium]